MLMKTCIRDHRERALLRLTMLITSVFVFLFQNTIEGIGRSTWNGSYAKRIMVCVKYTLLDVGKGVELPVYNYICPSIVREPTRSATALLCPVLSVTSVSGSS